MLYLVIQLMTLERLSHITLLVCAPLAIAIMGYNVFFSATRSRPDPRSMEKALRNSHLTIPASVPSSHGVLLFVLSSNCKFCTLSGEFYQRITAARSRDNSALALIGVVRDPESTARTYTKSLNYELDQYVASAAFGSQIAQLPTPSLIMLDGQRRVTDVWIGQAAQRVEKDILAKVSSPH